MELEPKFLEKIVKNNAPKHNKKHLSQKKYIVKKSIKV